MFDHYTLSRQTVSMGFRLKLTLFVDVTHQEATLMLMVNGLIDKGGNPPHFWEVDSPTKAELWFRRINLDQIGEQMWLEQREAGRLAPPSPPQAG